MGLVLFLRSFSREEPGVRLLLLQAARQELRAKPRSLTKWFTFRWLALLEKRPSLTRLLAFHALAYLFVGVCYALLAFAVSRVNSL